MRYTVHEVAELSGTTIKTLYHYQKIGLLIPKSIGDNGYRYYGDEELERLQQILFYRELEFPLDKIKMALENEPSRLRCLYEQKSLMKARHQRFSCILHTLDEAIICAGKGVTMNKKRMFNGLNKEEWETALAEQNEHLQETYGFQIDSSAIKAEEMNEKAAEATEFITFMADALKNGVSVNDESVVYAIRRHIAFLQKDMSIDAKGFVAQTKFLMTDNFHRKMLEEQQTGLSYFICFAAENYAEIA